MKVQDSNNICQTGNRPGKQKNTKDQKPHNNEDKNYTPNQTDSLTEENTHGRSENYAQYGMTKPTKNFLDTI